MEYVDGTMVKDTVDLQSDRAVMDNKLGGLTILNLTADDGGRYMCDFICHERAELELSVVREYLHAPFI